MERRPDRLRCLLSSCSLRKSLMSAVRFKIHLILFFLMAVPYAAEASVRLILPFYLHRVSLINLNRCYRNYRFEKKLSVSLFYNGFAGVKIEDKIN